MLKGLRTIVYHAPDLEGAKTFYTQLTETAPYFEEPYYIGFNINGIELGLDPDLTNITKGNNQVVYWKVDAIAPVLQKAIDLGGSLVQDATNVGEDTFVAQFSDPWGNVIGLIEEKNQ
jgi:predicted enzyme related to lactoylglutathione lyase